jgi:tetratricopeptide (TPR) repeat protein
MKRFLLLVLTGITLVFSSCDSTKQLANTAQSAQQAFDRGDYAKALEMWEEVINSYKQKDAVNQCPVYTDAGMAALKLGQTDKAIDYLKQAGYSDFSNENTYLTLADIYRQKDNLSLELVNLETYLTRFPEGTQSAKAKKRLLALYVESENWEKAASLWETLTPEQQNDTENIESFLIVNSALNNNETCLKLSDRLLRANENNVVALDWLANYYFWKAEKRYQKEMKDYKAHQTRKQYAHLLKALERVSSEYKKSLHYGTKLYKVNPTAKTAKLLSRCYNRLDNKKKAAYYKKLADK